MVSKFCFLNLRMSIESTLRALWRKLNPSMEVISYWKYITLMVMCVYCTRISQTLNALQACLVFLKSGRWLSILVSFSFFGDFFFLGFLLNFRKYVPFYWTALVIIFVNVAGSKGFKSSRKWEKLMIFLIIWYTAVWALLIIDNKYSES